MGLPHRNSSVFKQTPYQSIESKRKNKKKAWGEHQRIDIRRSIRRKLQKQWRRIETQASEAKGPFPGGKRVGSWGKKKRKRKKKVDPPSAVGGLEGIDKRVGSWGKKKRNGWNNSKREEGWELGEEKERKREQKKK